MKINKDILIALADSRKLPSQLDEQITRATKDAAYYERQLMRAVQMRYEEKTDDDEFLTIATILILSQLRRAYREGLREVGVNEWDLAYENDLDPVLQNEQNALRKLLQDIKFAILALLGWESFRWRVALYANRYLDVFNRAMVTGGKRNNARLMWELGATERHCTDCSSYANEIKTAQEWDDIYRLYGHKPQAYELECKGFNCDCRFVVMV